MGLLKRKTYVKPIFIKKKFLLGFKYIIISKFAEFAENISSFK